MPKPHKEPHRIKEIGWLRAAVLGANDGIISTASRIIGVASAHAEHGQLVLTGLAGFGSRRDVDGDRRVRIGLVAGGYRKQRRSPKSRRSSMRMAREHGELAATYVRLGLDMALAKHVAPGHCQVAENEAARRQD
jgi:VIT1/CCC1 family predicted Fe2+/Mn2+ transporter